MNKYEISVWNDIYDEENNRYTEEKIAVIGSYEMRQNNVQDRAREPKLVENVNGTNTFTFKMFYNYIDTITGEFRTNPFINFLVNERKIKVYWKNKWYEFIIKDCKEDSLSSSFSYTCEDLYVTELSRNGFNLTFDTKLSNNIGTAQELVNATLEGTDWQLDPNSEKIYQEVEEGVYETSIINSFIAYKNPLQEETQINVNEDLEYNQILVYYSIAQDINHLNPYCQFYYKTDKQWQHDQNDMLVINGNCYNVQVTWQIENTIASAYVGDNKIFELDLSGGLSENFRAKRYVQSQKSIYNSIVDRYVNVYNYQNGIENLLGYQTTVYNDALAVVNLVSNASDFANFSGWIGEGLQFKLSPPFNAETKLIEYSAKSYLYLSEGFTFNSGIQNNRTYIPNGFNVGEKYIFRIRAKDGATTEPGSSPNYITNVALITPYICSRNSNYEPTNTNYFTIVDSQYDEVNKWLEYQMQCEIACSYNDLISTMNPFGIFLECSAPYWLEEAQFYKEVWGEDGEGNLIRINPNQLSTQSIVQPMWRYFLAEQSDEITEKDLSGWYFTSPWEEAEPVYNNFEKYGTISISQSNRFNILQSIAEAFECWVRFNIEHDEKGYILYDDNNKPCKYIKLVKEIGEETGLGFRYGVDLKSVERDIVSSSISTKTIVAQNENEFGKDGFCSIARSSQNYPKENFIYNFDYYINQGMLNRSILNADLYGTNGYYTNLNNLNSEYQTNLELLIEKRLELTKQQAMLTVYDQYLSSTAEEIEKIEDDIIKLAGGDQAQIHTFLDTEEYIRDNPNNTKVITLMNDRSQLLNIKQSYTYLIAEIQSSINTLQNTINAKDSRQEEIIAQLDNLHSEFYKKYSRFIQEGTWSSEDYFDDNLYYIDALQVAYTSSRPQITYTINVLRLSDLEEYKAKVFNLGDICYIQDPKFFGYLDDGFTPYKEKVLISEITSEFDSPDKDNLKIQNYKTQFEDLFQRITAATQNLEFSAGKYAKAANIMNTDGTIKSSVIQSTFDENIDIVQSSVNDNVITDNTGITVTDNTDAAKRVKLTSGGLFVSDDGGVSWNNAVRGDGITADVITTGKLNTENVVIYGSGAPSFTWDEYGINAYALNSDGSSSKDQFVRFDKFGIYGIRGQENYRPESEEQIYSQANFGLTWNKFFMKNNNTSGGITRSVEISSDADIVVKENDINRVIIGRIDPIGEPTNYGIQIRNNENDLVFSCDNNGALIAGWELGRNDNPNYGYIKGEHIEMRSNGTIGCFNSEASTQQETAYKATLSANITATKLGTTESVVTINSGTVIYIFSSSIGNLTTFKYTEEDYNENEQPTTFPSTFVSDIYFAYGDNTYRLDNISIIPRNTAIILTHNTKTFSGTTTTYLTSYTFTYQFDLKINNTIIINGLKEGIGAASITTTKTRYIPASEFEWSIDSNGQAIFHDIFADYGKIAGWWIDNEKIYQTRDGSRNGEIIAQLNSQGASSEGYDYSIITEAIKSAIADVSMIKMDDLTLTTGYFAALINNIAGAYNVAYSAMARANEAYNHLPAHWHSAGNYYVLASEGTLSVQGGSGTAGTN